MSRNMTAGTGERVSSTQQIEIWNLMIWTAKLLCVVDLMGLSGKESQWKKNNNDWGVPVVTFTIDDLQQIWSRSTICNRMNNSINR